MVIKKKFYLLNDKKKSKLGENIKSTSFTNKMLPREKFCLKDCEWVFFFFFYF